LTLHPQLFPKARSFPTCFLQNRELLEFAASTFPLVYDARRRGNEGETITKITSGIWCAFLNCVDLLNLPHWQMIDCEERERVYLITAAPCLPRSACPACGSLIVVKHAADEQTIRDLSCHGKQVVILVNRIRYRCKACRKTWFEVLPEVDEHRSATCRLVRYVQQQSLFRPFVALAAECGLDEKSVRTIFHEYVLELEQVMQQSTPRVLGLDELHLMGQPRGMITDIEARRFVVILPDRKKATVARYLQHLPDKDRIQVAVIDMHAPYLQALTEQLPQVFVVIDRFHVIQLLNRAVDQARKAIRDSLPDRQRRQLMHDRFLLLKRHRDLKESELLILEAWLNQFPELQAIYLCKEAFANIYELPSLEEAEDAYVAWLERVEQCGISEALSEFLRAVDNWYPWIFNYFRHRHTGGFVEGANALARSVDRAGRGYSFPVLRARLLYGQHLLRQTKRRAPKTADVQEVSHVDGPVIDEVLSTSETLLEFS
jgi:transposase